MKKYNVTFGFRTSLEFEVEAGTQIEAIEKAYEKCGELEEEEYGRKLILGLSRISTNVEAAE